MASEGDIKGNGSEQIEEAIPMEDGDSDQDESSEDDYLDDDEVDDEEENDEEEATEGEVIRRTYVPNANNADMEVGGDGDDELECDLSAYVMYHKAETGYPCLSFDVIADANNSADRVNTFPQTAYLVSGTNADKAHLNKLLILKLSQMGPVKKQSENDDEVDDSDDDDDEDLPDLQSVSIAHSGCVNRIRARTIGDRTVAATFSELGVVHLWDLSNPLAAIEDASAVAKWNKHQEKNPQKAIFSFAGHNSEGYAIDWSPTTDGRLATGDCLKHIFLWNLAEGGWIVDQAPLTGHTNSVEDLQWSPNEEQILASCSVDRSLRVWDVRMKASAAIVLPSAHNADINVISWNKLEKAFILSGGDDGAVKVWDLRYVRKGGSAGGDSSTCKPVATFKHHQQPITSVEWHPTDGTVFAASSDDQITLWDLAVEADADAAVQDGSGEDAGDGGEVKTEDDKEVAKLPPQLLFIHQGQKEVKEVHWHAQLPGVLISTAMNGFDIFRTISV